MLVQQHDAFFPNRRQVWRFEHQVTVAKIKLHNHLQARVL
jgi:hypothetical protein